MPLAPELTELSIERIRERRSAKWSYFGPDVLPAFVAEMDFPLAAPVKDAMRRAIDLDDTGYANPEATEIAANLAAFAERRMDWSPDPEQVITCNDVVAGLTDLLRLLTAPGDSVIVTPPVYHPFFTLVPEAGCKVREVPLADGRDSRPRGDRGGLRRGARAMVLCNPHNPTGIVCDRDELEALADLAAEHEAWILSDEIHAPLTLPGARHVPFLGVSENAAARGVSLVSASKTFNLAGLGCAQSSRRPNRRGVRRVSSILGPSLRPHRRIATAAAYADGDAWLDSVIEVLDHNRGLLGELLAETPPRCRLRAAGRGLPHLDRRERLRARERSRRPAPRAGAGRDQRRAHVRERRRGFHQAERGHLSRPDDRGRRADRKRRQWLGPRAWR